MQQSAIMIIANPVFKIICYKLRIRIVPRNKGLPELPPKRAENGLFCACRIYRKWILYNNTKLIQVNV